MNEIPTAVKVLSNPIRPVPWAHKTWERDRLIEAALAHPNWYQSKVLERLEHQSNGCMLWTGWELEGYGQVMLPSSISTRGFRVHRTVWLAERGPLALGWIPDHLCRNTLCSNIDHLEPVPIGINTMRGDSWSGKYGRRTHCPAGHEFTERKGVSGQRSCLICVAALTHVRDVLVLEAMRLSGMSRKALTAKHGKSIDSLIDAIGGEPIAIAALRSHAQGDALRFTACGKGRWANLARKTLGVTV